MNITGISSNDYSSWFNTSNKNVSSYSLSDYASIKNGSYRKLTNYYYGKSQSRSAIESQKQESAKKKIEYSSTFNSAAALSSSLSKLTNDRDILRNKIITKDAEGVEKEDYDRQKIASLVKGFTESYNSMIKNGGDSNNSTVIRNTYNMVNQTAVYEGALNRVGITINSDNTLAVDEDTLNKADVTSLRGLFGGNHSYATLIQNKADNIQREMTNQLGNVNGYTAQAQYNTMIENGDLFNQLL